MTNTLHTCCFFGHKEIEVTEELEQRLTKVIQELIDNKGVDTFLFGSKSRFDALCLEMVSKIKEHHPHIKRVYVRAEYQHIDDKYKNYLLQFYDDTYYPERISGAGRAVYVERNCEMINNSCFCVIYYHASQAPSTRKSGTGIALDYAIKKKKEVIMFP